MSFPVSNQTVEGGDILVELFNFILSVVASVVGNYISKWLDGEDEEHDQPSNKEPRACTPGFLCDILFLRTL